MQTENRNLDALLLRYRRAHCETFNNFFLADEDESLADAFALVDRDLFQTLVTDYISGGGAMSPTIVATPRAGPVPAILQRPNDNARWLHTGDEVLFQRIFDLDSYGVRRGEYILGKVVKGADDMIGMEVLVRYDDLQFRLKS